MKVLATIPGTYAGLKLGLQALAKAENMSFVDLSNTVHLQTNISKLIDSKPEQVMRVDTVQHLLKPLKGYNAVREGDSIVISKRGAYTKHGKKAMPRFHEDAHELTVRVPEPFWSVLKRVTYATNTENEEEMAMIILINTLRKASTE